MKRNGWDRTQINEWIIKKRWKEQKTKDGVKLYERNKNEWQKKEKTNKEIEKKGKRVKKVK